MTILIILSVICLNANAFWFNSSTKPKIIEIKAEPLDMEFEKSMAFDYLNTLRQKAGLSKYIYNEHLEKAANSHALYLVRNKALGHYENDSSKNFTGKTPKDRVLFAGYNSTFVIENVSNDSLNYKDSIDGLFSAIYHRFGFLDFQSDEIGIGVAQNPKDPDIKAYVYNMGIYELNDLCSQKSYDGVKSYLYKICKNPDHKIKESSFHKAMNAKKASSQKIVVYPYDRQENVPPAFYKESPDPLPEYDVSGFPVSFQFNDYFFQNAKLTSLSLFDQNAKEVDAKILYHKNDPNNLIKKHQYALLPLKRLSYDMEYKVSATYTSDGKNYTKEWNFKTKKLPKPFFIIKKDRSKITISPDIEYTLYFEPLNAHDVLNGMRFPADLKIKFLDQNTIRIKLVSNKKESFKLISGNKTVEVSVRQ